MLSLRDETEFLHQFRGTAEQTIGLMLALLRRVPVAVNHVNAGGWNRDVFRGPELNGSTVGVLGYGRLGSVVAGHLAAFGAHVRICDPHVSKSAVTGLEELLQNSDIVTVHINFTERNRGFIGRAQFDAMRSGAYFINTSRGELIDEAALLAALKSGHLAGAALDGLTNKQAGVAWKSLVAYARSHENLIITPHTGDCAVESPKKMKRLMVERLTEFCNTPATVLKHADKVLALQQPSGHDEDHRRRRASRRRASRGKHEPEILLHASSIDR